jgi:hypothetical protein
VSDTPQAGGASNAEVRRWYLARVAQIPELNQEWLRQGLSLRERAQAAWRVRYEARLQARDMMADPAEVSLLRARDEVLYGDPDGPSFAFLVERLSRAGLAGDAIYEAIIIGSYRTDAGVNKSLGF